jgi:hypothetical protein
MSSDEYRELKEQMDRMERLLSRIAVGTGEPKPAPLPPPPEPAQPAISGQDLAKARQAEGHYILATQGMVAYKRFWQEQSKKDKKPRLRSAA